MGEDILGYGYLGHWMGPIPHDKPREGMGYVHRPSDGYRRHRLKVVAKRRAARKNAKAVRRG